MLSGFELYSRWVPLTLFTATPWILKRLNVTHYYAFVYF